jgi:hypothetical protein
MNQNTRKRKETTIPESQLVSDAYLRNVERDEHDGEDEIDKERNC